MSAGDQFDPATPRRAGFLAALSIVLLALLPAAIVFGLDRVPTEARSTFVVLGAIFAVIGVATPGWLAWRSFADRASWQERLVTHLGDTMTAARLTVDARGRQIWSNRKFAQSFGVREDQALDDLMARLCGDDEGRLELERLWRSVQVGQSGSVAIAARGPGGEAEHYEIIAEPWQGLSGASSWIIQDITARRRIEEVLEEERAKIIDFLEHAPVGSYSLDGEGRFVYMNGTLAGWLGLVGGLQWDDKLRLHDVLAERPPYGTSPHDPFGDGERVSGEVVFRARDGGEIPVFVSQTVVTAADGTRRVRAVVRDQRVEREMAAALERTEQGFRRVFEEAPVAIVRLVPDGRIEACNSAFGRLTGLAADAARGLVFVDLLRPEDRAEIGDRLERIARGADPTGAMELRLAAAGGGGRESVLSLYASRVEREAAGRGELVLHFLDVTEQKRLELQFGHAMKMQAVGQLAGGVAHDFNNLLTAMIGFCDLLLLRHRAGDPSFADIMQIKQNANRAANLVRQLLAFSRQQRMQPKVLDITDALTEISHLLRRLIGENIELGMVHARDLHLVRVDQGQFEQVVINLAVNARDAMPGGGKLTIRTGNLVVSEPEQRGVETIPAGDYVTIEVQDTGIGIPPEIISRIFEPFFSTKEVGSGTGLGLSTVYGIVKQTGGFIFVDSEQGAGTSFRIYLPRWHGEAEKGAAEPTSEPRKRDTTGAGTVLLVEDEDAVRLFSARALRNKGYKVVEAKSGENALELLLGAGAQMIDVLITDVVMPQMDGTELIRRVRDQLPTMKVICISGYAEETFRKRLDSTADVHFLPKPFSLEQLAGKVKEVIH